MINEINLSNDFFIWKYCRGATSIDGKNDHDHTEHTATGPKQYYAIISNLHKGQPISVSSFQQLAMF